MAKKKKHGGKREGAGRKPSSPEGPTIVVAASVPEVLVEVLDSMADRNGWNRSQAITNAIRAFVATPKRG